MPVVLVSPVVLPAPDRGHDLHVRVSAPATGAQLPVIVFAHGFGSSLDGYAPLVHYWAAHGFVVIQRPARVTMAPISSFKQAAAAKAAAPATPIASKPNR